MRTRNMGLALTVGVALGGWMVAAAESDFFRLVAPVETTITAVRGDGTIEWTGTVAGVTGTVQRALSPGTESNWTDYVRFEHEGASGFLKAIDPNPPAGMAFIPAGSFSMGDSFGEGWSGESPVHTVYVSAFYMDKTEVTKAKWDEVYSWATNSGYSFDQAGAGKAANHPVQSVTWHDVVKWCNARSQKEGLTPCYTVSGAVYKTEWSVPDCNWSAGGYRLPTEAEWEKAARGGAVGQRFPWGGICDHSRANYFADPSEFSYDAGYIGHDTRYATGGTPYTSPVGSFEANGYGLFDMAGNVWEWCWDWYGSYASGSQSDPRGPDSGTARVGRGGGWGDYAGYCRTAIRYYGYPLFGGTDRGFRSVRPLAP